MSRLLLGQLLRFAASGGLTALSDLSVYTTLTLWLDVRPVLANLVSRPIGGAVSFFLNKHWTFGNRGQARTRVQISRYFAVWCLGFCVSEGLVWLLNQELGLRPVPTKILAEGGASLLTFFCHRHWTFR